jgi:exportin-1
MNIEAAGQQLMDFTKPFDVNVLDQVVEAMFNPSNPQRPVANRVLMALQEHQDMWTRVDAILEQAQNPNTRFFGLQVMEDTIKFRWRSLPAEQRDGIKNYIVGKVISLSSDDATMQRERVFLRKLNLVLVQILKQEWPANWPNFITELVQASKTSEILCENNMVILKLLSEEVFEFSKDQMTTAKIKVMKESLNSEFKQIFSLCEFILDNSQKPQLLSVTLQTLLRFLQWIPLGYVFETKLINNLLVKFFPVPTFRNDALQCLTEIGSLSKEDIGGEQYEPVFQQLYNTFMNQLVTVLPPDTDLVSAFENGTSEEEEFIKRLALFFTGFFKAHLTILELPENQNALMQGFTYLVKISEVDDEQVFKICLDYYHLVTQDLYQSECQGITQGRKSILNLGGGFGQPAQMGRKNLYSRALTRVRLVMIQKMVRPEEVLIKEDENGEIVKETTKDTEVLAQYKTMRETLVFLTHLDYEDAENIMLEKLAMQVDGSEWSWNNLNTLCWAIGSISGAMNEEDEKRFLVTVIKDLLGLCENKRGKDNKAVIASNIMYVVGQYPRFLRAHWKFLKTVVNKLFEFMHELHPGVQDMACETFLKIAQKCRRKFVTIQTAEREPFIEELLRTLPTIISALETHQIHTFYEAVGCMLSSQAGAQQRDKLLSQLMALPNGAWQDIMNRASTDINSLMQPETVKEVVKILRTNTSCCQSVGAGFISQLGTIYLDMLNVYKAYSEHISQAVATQGPMATRTSHIRAMRSAKKETLQVIEKFITKSEDPSTVATNFIPPLLVPVLGDYQRGIPEARDPEVLSLMATAINKLKGEVSSSIPQILEAIFECTLQMITANFEDFPEHRINFFTLLKAVNTHCFQSLFAIPAEHQKLVVDSVVWALKHQERNISDTGLEILYGLLQNVGNTPAVAQGFYQSYFLSLLQHILEVLTDRLHKTGFKMHATILKHMFTLVESGQITVPLYAGREAELNVPAGQPNQQFLREYTANMLSTSFGNLSKEQITGFVTGLFDMTKTLPDFKILLRDFLIQCKEFAGEDNAALFSEETQQQQKAQQDQARQAALAVPGVVNPYDQPEDMADL